MPWTLEHCPANEEWSKAFETEAEAIAELRKHICESCMTGRFEYVDTAQEGGLGFEQRKAPDPGSAYDLLSTPCGCEYELSETPKTPKEDSRPRKNFWAPGGYYCKCEQCCEKFIGDKRALICADCAYSETVAVTNGDGK